MGMTDDGLSYWQAESEGRELLEVTIGDLIDQRAEELPTREAVVYSHYPEFGEALTIRWTYREYRDRANAVAKGLIALGLNKGDHIAVWAANIPEWLLLEIAAAKLGLLLVTINPLLQAEEVEYILKQGEVQALFFMAQVRTYDHLSTVRSLVTPGAHNGYVTSERLLRLRYVSLMGMPPADLLGREGWRPTLLREIVAAGSAVADAAVAERQATVNPRDPAMMMYTSGTTGSPKGALLTHRGLLNNGWLLAQRLPLSQTDRYCTPLPFFHVGACVGSVLASLTAGCTLHPMIAFDPVKALQIMSGERCTCFLGAPTMLLAVLQHPDFDNFDLSSLTLVLTGGAPIPVTLMEQVHARTGADVSLIYAQTESSCSMTQTLPGDPFERKAATCGVPLPHTEIKVIDPVNGKTVHCGERGEICTRGYLVMVGYYKMPEKTAETIDRDGWLHTGDLATMDATGHVNIVGRLKDMVIRGSENLFPAEIEAFLMRHPKVAEAQVIGVPDAFFGEESLAVIRLKEGERLSEQELRAFCKDQISHQKVPRYFQFVESYPMTASGKVQKYVLREQAIHKLGLEDTANVRTA